MLALLIHSTNVGTAPTTRWPPELSREKRQAVRRWFALLFEEARAHLTGVEGITRTRLAVTVREAELIFAEMEHPLDEGRPIYPRIIRVVVSLMDNVLL